MLENAISEKEEARRAHIIAIAFDVLTLYGYKRTTMDDIAKAAGMSRPALYLLYKNKTDIFRACILDFVGHTQQRLATCFDTSDAPLVQISNALVAGIVEPMRKIIGTPHGAELLQLKELLAEDLSDQWIQMIENETTKGIRSALSKGLIELPSISMTVEDFVSYLVDAAEGIKYRTTDPDVMEIRIRNLVTLMISPMVR
jgi:AcrR family transcriptional regulator